MIEPIFLGPWSHWLLNAILIALGWYAGQARYHVIYFNTFLLCVVLLVTGDW